MSASHWAETAVITVKPATDADPLSGETTVIVCIDDGKEPFEFDITVKIGKILETLTKQLNDANKEIIQLKSVSTEHVKQYESTRIQQLNEEVKSLRDSLGAQIERNRDLDVNLLNLNGNLSNYKNELATVKIKLNETLQKLDSVQKEKKSDTDNIDYLKKELVNSRNMLSQAKSDMSNVENDYTNKLYTSKLEIEGIKKDLMYHKNELDISLNINKGMKKEFNELIDINRKLKDELSRHQTSVPNNVIEKEYHLESSSNSEDEERVEEVKTQEMDIKKYETPISTPNKAEESVKNEFIDPLTPLSDGFAVVGSFFTTFLVPDIIGQSTPNPGAESKPPDPSKAVINSNTITSPIKEDITETATKVKKIKSNKVKVDQVEVDLTNRMLTSELAKYKDAEQFYRAQTETLTFQLDDLTRKYSSVIATSVSGNEVDRLYREIEYMKELEKDKESQYNTKIKLYEEKALALNIEITNYNKIISDQKKEIDNLQLQCNELSNKSSKFDQVWYELDNTKKELMSTKNSLIDYQAKMNQMNAVEVKLAAQNNSIIEINQNNHRLLQEIDSYKIQISELTLEKDRLMAVNSDNKHQNVELSVLKGEILNLQTKIASIEREKVQLERNNEHSGRVFKELNAAKTTILELQSKITDLSLANQRLQASYDASLQLQDELRDYKRVNSELKGTLNELYNDSNKLKELEFTNIRVSNDSQNQVEIIAKLKEEIEMLSKSNHTLNERCREYDRVSNELSTTKYQILELRNQINDLNNLNKKLKDDIGNSNRSVENNIISSEKEQRLTLEIESLNKFISELYTTNNKLLADAKNDLNEFYEMKDVHDVLLVEVEMLKNKNYQLLLRCQYLSELETNKEDMLTDIIRSYPKGEKSIEERIKELQADIVREEKERVILLELKNKEAASSAAAGNGALFGNKKPVSVAEIIENHKKSTVDDVMSDVSGGLASVGSVFSSMFPSVPTESDKNTAANGSKPSVGSVLTSIFPTVPTESDKNKTPEVATRVRNNNEDNNSANGIGIDIDAVSSGVTDSMVAVGSFFSNIFPITPTSPEASTSEVINSTSSVISTPPTSSRRVSFSANKIESTDQEAKKKKKKKTSDTASVSSEPSISGDKKKKKKTSDTASVNSEPSVSGEKKKKKKEKEVSETQSSNEIVSPPKSALKKPSGESVYRVDPSKVVATTGYYDDEDEEEDAESAKKGSIFSYINPMNMFKGTPQRATQPRWNAEETISSTSVKYR